MFIRFYRTSSKKHLQLSDLLEEVIIGSLLGDLTAERKSIKNNTRLQFKQSIKNKDYILHLYDLFKDYCGTGPIELSKFDSRPNKQKAYKAIKFQTYSLPCFNKYKEMFYNSEGLKIIPLNLEDILTARGLAYWVMDDGYNYGKGFYICTDSYTLKEQEKLCQILKNKFDLDCKPHKHSNGYRLYIYSTSKDRLLLLINPYMLDHFSYKFESK